MRFSNLIRMVILGLLLIPVVSNGVLFANESRTTNEPRAVDQEMVFEVLPAQSLSVGSFDDTEGQETIGLATVQIPNPSFRDLARGFIEQKDAVELEIVSNIPWRVTVSTSNSDMGRSSDGSASKPVSDFQVRGNGKYQSVSNEDQILIEGSGGSFKIEIDYRMLFDAETYKEGDYELTLTYTIAGK